MVECPICGKSVKEQFINAHIDANCEAHVGGHAPSSSGVKDAGKEIGKDIGEDIGKGIGKDDVGRNIGSDTGRKADKDTGKDTGKDIVRDIVSENSSDLAAIFRRKEKDREAIGHGSLSLDASTESRNGHINSSRATSSSISSLSTNELKRAAPSDEGQTGSVEQKSSKKIRQTASDRRAPLAERRRPKSLDEVCGQELVGQSGVLRGLIEQDRVPSMILWGSAGSGKTTIARLIAKTAGTRFVEINSTSSGVAECKKLFDEAKNELGLTGRKTIIFCDEVHRFNKAQQDVFLGPVESGQVTLIAATTENPSFKVVSPLLSRCRTFTLSKLTDGDIVTILTRALHAEVQEGDPKEILDEHLLQYLAAFSDGDARTALNLLELAIDLAKRPDISQEQLKRALTHTLVYDRAGDQHYNTISAFHKSVRGSDPDAALYYLARMLQSGEDALYIARRMVVIASEDIGLADNSMLPLATAAYVACERVGMPEARINLAHATVALALSKKSTRAYRGLSNAMKALGEPGVAAEPVPVHLRNAPTRLMKELGYGNEYKYNPDYLEGKVAQEYMPEKLRGRRFLEDADLGTKTDPDLISAGQSNG